MPIMLEEGVGESFTDKKVISEAVDKIVRIGIRNTTYLPILESEKIPFEVEYVDTDELLEGETVTLTDGVLGELTKIYRELRDSNTGELLSEKEYVTELVTSAPVKMVVKRGTKKSTTTVQKVISEEIPYQVISIPSNELKAGERVVQRVGKNGTIEYLYQYVLDSEGHVVSAKLISSKVIEEAVDEIVHVGVEDSQEMLPNTGSHTDYSIFSATVLSILASIGLIDALNDKKKLD